MSVKKLARPRISIKEKRRLDRGCYLPLIAQKAREVWFKLPPRRRRWVDIDDLIQDGVLFARFHVLKYYRADRACFSTFLTVSLDHFYRNMQQACFYQKRNAGSDVPILNIQYDLEASDETEFELSALQGLEKVFLKASPALRQALNHWLFDRGHNCYGGLFPVVKEELLGLSKKCGFTCEDFSYLLHKDNWRKKLPSPAYIRPRC